MPQATKNKFLKGLSLELGKECSKEDPRRAQNKMAFKVHPDQGNNTEATTRVIKADEILASELD